MMRDLGTLFTEDALTYSKCVNFALNFSKSSTKTAVIARISVKLSLEGYPFLLQCPVRLVCI
jgi:hypothetical protein